MFSPGGATGAAKAAAVPARRSHSGAGLARTSLGGGSFARQGSGQLHLGPQAAGRGIGLGRLVLAAVACGTLLLLVLMASLLAPRLCNVPAVQAVLPGACSAAVERQARLTAPCVVLHSAPWGFGSALVNIVDSLTLWQRSDAADTRYYLNHTASPYQCRAKPQPGDWRMVLNSSLPLAPPTQGADLSRCQHRYIKNMTLVRAKERARVSQALGISIQQLEFGRGLDAAKLRERQAATRRYLEEVCETVERTWVLSPDVQAFVNVDRERLGLLQRPLVAVHVRGGDKLGVEMPPDYLDQYKKGNFTGGFEQLKRRFPGSVGGTCIIFGDDAYLAEAVAANAKAQMNCGIVNRVDPMYRHKQWTFNKERLQARCARWKVVLADIDALASAEFTVGTAHSNVDDLAYRIAGCIYKRDLDTYVDALGWSMDNAWSRVKDA